MIYFPLILNLPFKKVDMRLIRSYVLYDMTDDDLFNEIMKVSKYENILPHTNDLRIDKCKWFLNATVQLRPLQISLVSTLLKKQCEKI